MQKFLCMFVCELRLCGGTVDPLKLPSSGRGQSPNALEPFKHWLQVPFAPKVLKALGLGLVWAELSVQRGETAYPVANREREGGGGVLLSWCPACTIHYLDYIYLANTSVLSIMFP